MNTKQQTNHNIRDLFNELLDEWQFIRRRRPETIRILRESYKHFLRLMPEVTFVEDVNRGVIVTFLKRLQTHERIVGKGEKKIGVKDITIRSYGTRLKMFFGWLLTRRIIRENPFEGIKLPNPIYTDHRALSGKEIRMLLGAVAQFSRNGFILKRDIAIIGTLTFCGLRRRELIGLELRDLDLANNLLTVRGETSKSAKTRSIPINLQLRHYLKEYLAERNKGGYKTFYLFASNQNDSGLTLHGLKHWVIRLSKMSGVKFHLHRIRHTFATNLACNDVGVIKIQKLLGHRHLSMTQVYVRSIRTEKMRDDVNRLSFENLT